VSELDSIVGPIAPSVLQSSGEGIQSNTGITAKTEKASGPTWIGLSLGLPTLIVTAVLLYIWRWHNHKYVPASPDTSESVSNIKTRRSIAMLGFQNLPGRPEAAWLSTALSEMLSTELAADGTPRTIPGEDVSRLKLELSLAGADAFSKRYRILCRFL
jgi:hypothetical protein